MSNQLFANAVKTGPAHAGHYAGCESAVVSSAYLPETIALALTLILTSGSLPLPTPRPTTG